MKKLAALFLIAAMSLQMTACGGLAGSGNSAWIEEGAGKIGTTLDCGQFVIDGEVHSFPTGISDWTNNGWHISNNYSNKDSFRLESDIISNEFEVFNDKKDSQYVSMLAINLGPEPAKIEDCTVDYLEISLSQAKNALKVVLPGGITCKSTKEDVNAAYGAPTETEDDTLYYTYTSQDGLDIIVGIRFLANTADQVVYSLSNSNWGYVDDAEGCAQFIEDALKASFYCDYKSYVEHNFDTEEGSQELYDAEVEYYVQGLMYYLDINYETVSEEIIEEFRELAKKIFTKFKWDAPVVNLADGATYGDFELTMYPTDFLDIILDDAQAVTELGLEGDEYAESMLEAISPKVDGISYREPITNTYDIDLDDGVVSANDWDEIDDILMDFAE